MARNATDDGSGARLGSRYLLMTVIQSSALRSWMSYGLPDTRPLMLPPRSPNLNAFAERWVRSVQQECLSRLILFGETNFVRF